MPLDLLIPPPRFYAKKITVNRKQESEKLFTKIPIVALLVFMNNRNKIISTRETKT